MNIKNLLFWTSMFFMSASHANDEQTLALQKAQTMVKLLQQEKNKLMEEKISLTQQVNQLTAERDSLKKEATTHAKAAQELAATKKQFAQTQQRLTGLEAEQQALSHEREQLAEYLKVAKQKMGALAQQSSKTEENLLVSSSELAKYKDQFSQCQDKNARLVELSQQLMTSYSKKGVVQALLQAEPITQVQRVEMENLVQEYKHLLKDNAVAEKE